MKKRILIVLALLALVALGFAWALLGPGTGFEEKNHYLLIKTGSTYEDVLKTVREDKVVSSPALFEFLAKRLDYPQKVKAGRYEIKKGMSLLNIVRILRNGKQEPVNLVITKLRTKEDLAGLVGRRFESDSLSFIRFLNNNDTLKAYGLDSNTVMTAVLPNTYTYFWNSTPSRIFARLHDYYAAFWTSERLAKAKQLGLTAQTAYTLASIVEEESTKKEDKGKIASVYLNRIAKGMRLSADPTVKFALRDFGLKRIYEKHLAVESPYNTYRVSGLPPGPICTPSESTLDAVLDAPHSNYLYFVAKPSFDGYSNFAETYEQHLVFANAYRKALDSLMKAKSAVKAEAAQ
jgi:UPF0755 protein